MSDTCSGMVNGVTGDWLHNAILVTSSGIVPGSQPTRRRSSDVKGLDQFLLDMAPSAPRQLLPFEPVPLFLDEHHGVKLVGGDLVEAHGDAEFHRGTKIEGPANQLAWLGGLGRVEPVQRAVITPATVRRIRAEAGIAEFLAAQGPVDQEPQGGPLRPLPVQEFGEPSS